MGSKTNMGMHILINKIINYIYAMAYIANDAGMVEEKNGIEGFTKFKRLARLMRLRKSTTDPPPREVRGCLPAVRPETLVRI